MKYLISIISIFLLGSHINTSTCHADVCFSNTKVDSIIVSIPLSLLKVESVEPSRVFLSIPPTYMWVDLEKDSVVQMIRSRVVEDHFCLAFLAKDLDAQEVSSIELWMTYNGDDGIVHNIGPIFIICDDCQFSKRMLDIGGAIMSRKLRYIENYQ